MLCMYTSKQSRPNARRSSSTGIRGPVMPSSGPNLRSLARGKSSVSRYTSFGHISTALRVLKCQKGQSGPASPCDTAHASMVSRMPVTYSTL